MTDQNLPSHPNPYGPLLRILLRYVSATMVTAGAMSQETAALVNDPDLVPALIALWPAIAGSIVALATEGYYMLAKKRGWNT